MLTCGSVLQSAENKRYRPDDGGEAMCVAPMTISGLSGD